MKNEEQLTVQLQGLRDQFSLRKTSLQDHVGHLELMREEVGASRLRPAPLYHLPFIPISVTNWLTDIDSRGFAT